MDPILAGIVAEMTKAVILAVIQSARHAGMTVEEVQSAYVEAIKEFRLNNPHEIPDV